ncbi:putative fibronectin-like [Apostichopus japonicus]|uniref:Putative fibronectin-like n=1 Tax=Stichopus japonicus TaxID=307972 RepID=A0A2G8LGQ9_STIJA|nr:putative fibronectin-like [Apostichopus japonicus]
MMISSLFPVPFVLSFFSTECSMKQPLIYGGRLAFIDDGSIGNDSPSPVAQQRVLVIKMPPSMSKGKKYPGRFGIGHIVMAGGGPCGGERSQITCPLATTEESICLDSSLPCYQTPPTYAEPEPLSFSGVTATSITVTWPAWDETVDHGHGPIVEYRIQIRGPGELEFTEIPKGRQLSHQFNDLNENTEYEFRIGIIRDHPFGDGRPSNVQTTRTSAGDLVITDLEYTSSSRRAGYASTTVTWSVEGVTDSHRVLSQSLSLRLLNVLECGGVPTTEDATPTVIDVEDGEARTKTIPRLTANSQYNLILRLNTQTGTYERSRTIQTTTTRSTGKPTNLRLETKTNGNLVFHWNKPECSQRNGPINSYYYTVAKFKPNKRQKPAPVIADHTEDNSIRLKRSDTRILHNAQYIFTVRATTGQGSGDLDSPAADHQFIFES